MGSIVELPRSVMQYFDVIGRLLDFQKDLDSGTMEYKMLQNQVAVYLEKIEKEVEADIASNK